MTVIVRLNKPVTSGICCGVRCLITGAAQVLAKLIASVNSSVPTKNPNHVATTDRIIRPTVNNPIITISVFSSPKRLPMAGDIKAPRANASIGTAPSQPIWVSEIPIACCTTGAIDPSATIGARMLVASKIIAKSTSQKVNLEEGRLARATVVDDRVEGESEETDITARRLK